MQCMKLPQPLEGRTTDSGISGHRSKKRTEQLIPYPWDQEILTSNWGGGGCPLRTRISQSNRFSFSLSLPLKCGTPPHIKSTIELAASADSSEIDPQFFTRGPNNYFYTSLLFRCLW